MSRISQSKAQTDANAKLLRAMVKQPDNKLCADCKRNDPRWASWNLGCFLCIRCSGIHRSLGTHISKVKSIDLDIWTPEQMAAIQAWGNKRANAYWEAHLKAGHSPPEHKVEAFIRSKYESRRWAKEGPPPKDPSVLDGPSDAASTAAAPSASSSAKAQPTPPKQTAADLLGGDPMPAPATTKTTISNFMDDGPPPKAKTTTASAPAPTPAAAAKTGGGGGLFDLDWNMPASSSTANATSPSMSGAAKGKDDILSLFSTPRPAAASQTTPTSAQNQFGGLTSSFGGLDLGSNTSTTAASNPWAAAAPSAAPASNDVWGDFASSKPATAPTSTGGASKDAFSDLWGDFK